LSEPLSFLRRQNLENKVPLLLVEAASKVHEKAEQKKKN